MMLEHWRQARGAAPSPVDWERTHRRTVLLGIAALVLLVVGPLFAEHALLQFRPGMSDPDHLGTLCLIALHAILEPVHNGFHLLLGAGLLYACWDRVRAWRMVRATLPPLDAFARSPEPGDPFWLAARAAGVDPAGLRIVSGLPSPAFTLGWLWPTIYLARELADLLTAGELVSVVAHEGAHQRRRDPLRLALLRFLSCTLFWIPAMARLATDVAEAAEVIADDTARRGRPLDLASAIVRLATWPRPAVRISSAIGFGPGDLLERRVRRLAGAAGPVQSRVTRRSVAWAAMVLGVLWASSAAVAHPLPTAAHAAHCEHSGLSVFLHLFCTEGSEHPSHDCPTHVKHVA